MNSRSIFVRLNNSTVFCDKQLRTVALCKGLLTRVPTELVLCLNAHFKISRATLKRAKDLKSPSEQGLRESTWYGEATDDQANIQLLMWRYDGGILKGGMVSVTLISSRGTNHFVAKGTTSVA